MILMSSLTHFPTDISTVNTMPRVSNSLAAKIPAKQPTIDSESAWNQVLSRDQTANFFYAVKTTGVFCRPDCASRRPLRANVRFFQTADAARAAARSVLETAALWTRVVRRLAAFARTSRKMLTGGWGWRSWAG
jgi:hypothetical protein